MVFSCLYFTGSAWNFEDDTDSTTSSETAMTSISDGPSIKRPSSQLFYTTPPKAVSIYIPVYTYILYVIVT